MKITVRIGAALDGDLKAILYEPLAEAGARARQTVRGQMGGLQNDIKAQTAAALKVDTAAKITAVRKTAAEELSITRDRLARERTMEAQERTHELSLDRDHVRKKANEKIKAARETAKETAKLQKEREGGVRSFASSATSTASGIVRRGVGVAGDIARGAGVSFDVSAGVKKRVALEEAATKLSNSGYMEGKAGPAGIKQDPRAVMADIQRTGEKFGIGQDVIAEALDKFVGKTGELQTGRDSLESFAKTAKATGASIEDVAAAAGAISNKLGDVPDKANAINKVMLAIAGQGKEGAVEIKDLASQMEKLTSQASKFQSNATLKGVAGTDVGANIAMLGVLAQAARKTEKGSAAQATQASMAFIRDLTGQTAIKRIGASTLFTDKTRTQLRDPQEIVKDIISKTKGDQTKLAYLLPNQNSRAVANSFMDPYMKAYQGTKGTEKEKDAAGRKAVDASFQVLKDATLSDKSQKVALDAALASTGTKVEQFQQKLDRVVGDMADKLIPVMLKLAGPTLGAADAMSQLAVWAANNPLLAGTAIVGASAGKAVVERGAGAVADKAVSAVAGAGALGGALVGTMIIASVGALTIAKVIDDKTAAQKKRLGQEAEALNTKGNLLALQRQAGKEEAAGGVSEETKAKIEKAKEAAFEERGRIANRISKARDQQTGEGTGFVASAANSFLSFLRADARVGGGETMEQRAKTQEDAAHLKTLNADMAMLGKAIAGTLKVEVVNLPGAGPPALPNAVTPPDRS